VGKIEEPENRNAIYCTQKEMVEAHLFMFENLWRHATPAQFRIKELFYLEGPQVVMQIVRQDKLIRFV